MFYSPHGLESWEIVAASGLFALGLLALFTTIGFVLAMGLSRDRAAMPVRAERPAPTMEPKPAAAPMTAKPEYAAVSA